MDPGQLEFGRRIKGWVDQVQNAPIFGVDDQSQSFGAIETEKEEQMSMNREELTARLEAVEARMDARVARIESQVERVLDSVNNTMSNVQGYVQTIQRDNSETRSMVSNSKWWAIGTGIAVLLGIWQIVTGLTQSNTALFEAGRGVGAAQQQTVVGKSEPIPPAPQSPPATKRGP